MPKIKNEISLPSQRLSNIEAQSVRKIFVNKGSSQSDLNTYNRRMKKKYLVKGRLTSKGELWDVFSLNGNARPQVEATGFFWQEEAIAFARDRSLGRAVFKAGNVRGMFRAGRAGIMSPLNEIETPGASVATITPTKNGVIVQ